MVWNDCTKECPSRFLTLKRKNYVNNISIEKRLMSLTLTKNKYLSCGLKKIHFKQNTFLLSKSCGLNTNFINALLKSEEKSSATDNFM